MIHKQVVFLKMYFWIIIKCECQGKWGGGISGGFDRGDNKSEEDTW